MTARYLNSKPHEVICPVCNGSGEGYCDNSICYACKGTGVQYYTDPDSSEVVEPEPPRNDPYDCDNDRDDRDLPN